MYILKDMVTLAMKDRQEEFQIVLLGNDTELLILTWADGDTLLAL